MRIPRAGLRTDITKRRSPEETADKGSIPEGRKHGPSQAVRLPVTRRADQGVRNPPTRDHAGRSIRRERPVASGPSHR